MNAEQARQEIESRVAVNAQMVALARIRCSQVGGKSSTQGLIKSVLDEHGIPPLSTLRLHDSNLDIPDQLDAAAKHISWTRAASEAIWSLIHENVFLPSAAFNAPLFQTIHYNYSAPDGSGTGSSFGGLEHYDIPLPASVEKAPSLIGPALVLSSPDLYLNNLSLSGAHVEVGDALKEAVACFRVGLFGAAAAMLGKASEGAWTELGSALLAAVPEALEASVQKQRKTIEDPYTPVPAKFDAVQMIYSRGDLFEGIKKASKVRPAELKAAQVWSEVVRDSRNAIHFGNAAAFANDYEKIACLLLAASCLRQLYAIKSAADDLSG